MLGKAGHGSQVLIADGNYAFSTGSPATAENVFLNLMPGVVAVSDVLKSLVEMIPIETAIVMASPIGIIRDIVDEYRTILPDGTIIKDLERFKSINK